MKITSGAKVLLVFNKKVLTILRDDKPDIPWPNMWDLPGGGQEEGETFEQTARREIEEELNIEVTGLMSLGIEQLEDIQAARFISYLTEEQFEQLKLGDEGQKFTFMNLGEISKRADFVPLLKGYVVNNMSKLKELVEKHAVD